MNKIYKTKWSEAKQAWVACSEISRTQAKSSSKMTRCYSKGVLSLSLNSIVQTLLAIGMAGASSMTWAQDCSPSGGSYSYIMGNTPLCDHVASYNDDNSPTHNQTYVVLIDSKATGQQTIGDIRLQNITTNDGFTGISVRYAVNPKSPYISAGNVTLKMQGAGGGIVDGGLQAHNGVPVTANDVDLDFNFRYTGGNSSGGAGQYGIIAGSSVNAGETNSGNFIQNNGLNGAYSTITVNDLTINQTASGGKTNPILNNGIRAIQGAHSAGYGDGSTGKVVVKGNLDMTLTGNRSIGIYVSGNAKNHGAATDTGPDGQLTPEVILEGGDSTYKITINKGNDSSLTEWDSHAIKLGKVRNTGEGSGILRSHGKLEINTENALYGGGIKMLRNSLLQADYDTSATKIRTAGYALQIGGTDDSAEFAASHGVKAYFHNADFQTVGTSKDPRSTSTAVARKDLIFVDQGQVGVDLQFSGEGTNLLANEEGYILNVSGDYDKSATYYANVYDDSGTEKTGLENFESSSVTFTAKDAGSMTGLVYKGLIKEADGQTARGTNTPILNLNLSDGFTWHLRKTGTDTTDNKHITTLFDNLNLNSGAILDAAFDDAGNNTFIVRGNVNSNGGIINLDNASHAKYDDTLTIDGNYVGSGGALVKMNTLWNAPGDANGGNSTSDKLIITGTATGSTKVIPIGADGTENVIDGDVTQVVNTVINTVPIVEVGQLGETAFTGTAQTSGISEVQLAKRTVNGKDEYYWTATAAEPTPAPGPIIYNQAVPAYVNTPRLNLEQGYTTLGTLHERRGENQTLAWDECGTCGANATGQTWGRFFGKHIELDGKERLDSRSNIYGFQFGHDFRLKRNDNGSHSLTGAYVAYSHASHSFYDQYRAENGLIVSDKYTGSGSSEAFSLGLTHTHYTANGSYLDLVGQFSWLRNKYRARDSAKDISQHGWGMALSAEVGRPFALTKHAPNEAGWLIEPQAQLIYQHLSLNKFRDDYREIKQGSQDGLRGRLGVRLAYNAEGKNYRTNTFYVVANVWHDFMGSKNIRIGRDRTKEKYATTWGEIGVGGQLPLGKQTYLYGDIRYEHSLTGTKRSAYRGTIGAKFTWK